MLIQGLLTITPIVGGYWLSEQASLRKRILGVILVLVGAAWVPAIFLGQYSSRWASVSILIAGICILILRRRMAAVKK